MKLYVSAKHAPPPPHAWISGPDEHEERPACAQTTSRQGTQAPDRRVTGLEHFRSGRTSGHGMTESLGPRERIRRRAEFSRVFSAGARVHGRFMTLVTLPTDRGPSRLGIVASRKLGGAVQRNRAKRLVREIFRRHKPAGLDVVVLPRPALLDADFNSLEADFRSTLRRRRAG